MRVTGRVRVGLCGPTRHKGDTSLPPPINSTFHSFTDSYRNPQESSGIDRNPQEWAGIQGLYTPPCIPSRSAQNWSDSAQTPHGSAQTFDQFFTWFYCAIVRADPHGSVRNISFLCGFYRPRPRRPSMDSLRPLRWP